MALNYPNSPTVGQVFDQWTWNGNFWGLTPAAVIPPPPQTVTWYQEATPPTTGVNGESWYKPSTNTFYVLEAGVWTAVTSPGGYVFVQEATPTGTTTGQTWFNTATGASYVWYDSFWVQTSPGGGPAAKVGGRWRRVAALSLPNATGVNIPWDTEDEDTSGIMAVGGTTITIPAGLDGVYSFSVNGYVGAVSGLIDVLIPNYLFNGVPSAVTGWISVSGTLWMAAGTTLYVRAWQNSGSAQNPTGAFLMNLWKVA